MNERIKLLAEQAEKYADYNFKGENFWSEAYESKFAELIVLECAEVVKWTPSMVPNDTIIKNIKEHFGVEEPKGWVCPKCNADRTKIACPLGFGATVDGRCPMTVEAQ
jgi:hypothetical protein